MQKNANKHFDHSQSTLQSRRSSVVICFALLVCLFQLILVVILKKNTKNKFKSFVRSAKTSVLNADCPPPVLHFHNRGAPNAAVHPNALRKIQRATIIAVYSAEA